MKEGETIRVETCGGGGYGPPWERDPALVLRDVREEKLSFERARDVYGACINPADHSDDTARTTDLRTTLRATLRTTSTGEGR